MSKVLFLDSVHPLLEDELIKIGYTCDHDYQSDYSTILNKLPEYSGIVIRSRIPVDRAFMEAGSNLKFIARSGAGLENIDLEAAVDHNIEVISAAEGNMGAVAEHCVGMLLALFNKMITADGEVRAGVWQREENRGLELEGKTVGIIGFGRMGRAFAQRLRGFDCTILSYDKYLEPGYSPSYVEEVELESLKARAEVISIHLPLSKETEHYVDRAIVEEIANPFFLINTARGKHVNTADLVDGLKSGKIRGACLDVLEYEKKSLQGLESADFPEPLQELVKMKNVVLSPHVAGWTVESYIKLSKVLAEKIKNL